MNAVDLLVEIIREHEPKDIWRDPPSIGYRMLGSTNRRGRGNMTRPWQRFFGASRILWTCGQGGRLARVSRERLASHGTSCCNRPSAKEAPE